MPLPCLRSPRSFCSLLRPSPSPPVAAEDLTPLEARILPMAALTKTDDAAVIQRMFMEC